VDVEKAEDFGLGIAEGVPDCAGDERCVFREFDHELHSQGPLFRSVLVLVECSANRADRPIADDGELGADVHAGHEAGQIPSSGAPVCRRPDRRGRRPVTA